MMANEQSSWCLSLLGVFNIAATTLDPSLARPAHSLHAYELTNDLASALEMHGIRKRQIVQTFVVIGVIAAM